MPNTTLSGRQRPLAISDPDVAGAIAHEVTRQADGLPLDRILVESPFDARVRYNLYSALVMLPRHQHRHLDQAEAAAGR